MSDTTRDAPSQEITPEASPSFGQPTIETQLSKSSHWVSSRMGALLEPLLPDVPQSVEAPDLVARLEALKKLLDASRDEEQQPSEVASAETSTENGNGDHQAPMPKFLQDQVHDEADDKPSNESDFARNLRETISVLTGRDRAQWMFLIATVVGSAGLLLTLEYFDFASSHSQRQITQITQVEPAPPEVRLNFMSEVTCDQPPCDALSTSISRTIATMSVDPALSASPGIVYATNPNLLVDDQSGLDPLDKVTVTGLPPDARLSVGQKTSDTEWTLAAGDLTDIGILVPNNHVEPIRATIEIKSRAGGSIAALGLTIEREAPIETVPVAAAPVEPSPIEPALFDPVLSMVPADPVLPAKDDKVADENIAPSGKRAVAPSSQSAKAMKALKAKVRQKKTKPPLQFPEQEAADTTKPPPTLFQGLLQGATKQTSASTSSDPVVKESLTESESSVPIPPSATVSNQPAGFETLRGLGGGFGLQPE